MQTHREPEMSECELYLSLVCGVDIVELDRFDRVLHVGGIHFLRRVYTEAELQKCAGRLPQLAARFAAKEAISKALGTGLRNIHMYEIEIVSAPEGRLSIALSGRAAAVAEHLRIMNWTLSLSHSPTLAIAFVVGSCLRQTLQDNATEGCI